jgi:hypothetical protein
LSRAERTASNLTCTDNLESIAIEASRCNELIYRPSSERRNAHCAFSLTRNTAQYSGLVFVKRHIAGIKLPRIQPHHGQA